MSDERQYFRYGDNEALDELDDAFDKGAAARLKDADYIECPYGLPDKEDWTQIDLLADRNAQRAGWLFGWWMAGWIECSGVDAEGSLHGGGHMAALLWEGYQGKIDGFPEDDDENMDCLVSEAEIASALNCSVEEVRERAEKEGWPYHIKPENPDQPILTVYPNPQDTTEGES